MRRASETWAAYIAMERSLRNIREARTLYKRCYARKFADGSQPAMCHAWLRFEREEGRYTPFRCSCKGAVLLSALCHCCWVVLCRLDRHGLLWHT